MIYLLVIFHIIVVARLVYSSYIESITKPLLEEIDKMIPEDCSKLLYFRNKDEYRTKSEKYHFRVNDINTDLLNLMGSEFKPILGRFTDLLPKIGLDIEIIITEGIEYLYGLFDYDHTLLRDVDQFLLNTCRLIEVKHEECNLSIEQLTLLNSDAEYIQLLSKYIFEKFEELSEKALKLELAYKESFARLQ